MECNRRSTDDRQSTVDCIVTVMRRPATRNPHANRKRQHRSRPAASLSATMAQADLCTMQRATAYSVHA